MGATRKERRIWQRVIGIGQIIGGLLYSGYGGAYGGSGGGAYLIGSGIANAGGSRRGTAGDWARSGEMKDVYSGYLQDLGGSFGAAGAQYGLGGGGTGQPAPSQTPDVAGPTLAGYRDLLTQLTDESRRRQMQAEQSYQTLQDYFINGGELT